jgi:hypothetical protein
MENEFGRTELANRDLAIKDLPMASDDWLAISEFALTFDGYHYWGSSDKCAEIANAHKADTLTELRTCLFFEQRRHHHYGEPPDAKTMKYIRGLVSKIRQKVQDRDFE